jgi:V/A-type H+-transporting ATPase subunit K
MEEIWRLYFTQTGLGWAIVGAMLAVMLGGIGSARGIRIAGAQAAGALSEKPEIFGKLLVLMALPGTQGFYAFIIAIFTAVRTGLLAGNPAVTPIQGLALLAVGLCAGIVQWRSAIYQGEASAAAINLVSRRPEEAGRAMLIPALVETYAVLALLASILFILWITGMTVQVPAVAQ